MSAILVLQTPPLMVPFLRCRFCMINYSASGLREEMSSRTSPKKIVRRNQSCQPCRSRKVRCDALRPTCSICIAQNRECSYEQDKRQVSRVSWDTIKLLESRLESMRDSIQHLEYNHGARLDALYDLMLPNVSHVSPPNLSIGNGSLAGAPNNPASHDVDGTAVATQGNTNGCSSSNHVLNEGLDETGIDEQRVLPNPVKVHELVRSEGHTAVYGPSSAFRINAATSSARPPNRVNQSSGTPQPSHEIGDMDFMASRSRLIANSALEVQKEWTYMTERKFDFDGLDFETGWYLLQLHWNQHHRAYLLTYRPALMYSLATNGPHMNKFLLNAIYLSAALISKRSDLFDDIRDRQSLGQRFYRRCQQLLLPELERSSIASSVGFLTLGSCLVSNGWQTAGWHYSGLGYRMIVDLGLHVSTDRTYSSDSPDFTLHHIESTDMDAEMSRRVFWGAFINDKFQSLYFGRPPALTATGIEPSRALLDTYEEHENWTPYPDPKDSRTPASACYFPQPAFTISTFDSLIDIALIMADVIEHLYSPRVRLLSKHEALRETKRIQNCLELWKTSLPKHLVYDPKYDHPPPAHRFYPLMAFHMLHILLHRPFLPEGHLRHFLLDESKPRRVCMSAAIQIYELAKAYRSAFTLRRAPYMFSYCLFSAASVIPFTSDGDEAHVHVSRTAVAMFFWGALKELQNGANFGLTKPMMLIRSLFERFGLELEAVTNNSHEHANSGMPRTEEEQSVLIDHPHGASGDTGSRASPVDNDDFDTLFRDLISGSLDGQMNMGNMDLDLDSCILYGLFR
ncbi:hypothetical protein BDV26DRAFT_251027 [Aspergillus bertholletiae]|uniref:Zn(2)-C6 fungal-type domain-containing protein n=1 Tax=Aspergillus bertholletiae TaxID=1226010 RepID=A0A5N7BQI2_9EURO|nr:hypothetical protein BDV26DRAFT_251027 [Aspergillus bertholletiae]